MEMDIKRSYVYILHFLINHPNQNYSLKQSIPYTIGPFAVITINYRRMNLEKEQDILNDQAENDIEKKEEVTEEMDEEYKRDM